MERTDNLPICTEAVRQRRSLPRRVWEFYRDGFRNMSTTGRWLWLLIIVKLFIMFFVIKFFFFPNLLERDYATDAERAQAVRESMLDDRRH